MNKNQLIVTWVIVLLLLIFRFGYADSVDPAGGKRAIKQQASELIINEEDLTYDQYKASLKLLTEVLGKYYKRKNKEIGWETENIGAHNSLLIIEGYGLKVQRDIARLELKKAKLNGVDKATVVSLEVKLKEAEKQLKYFLKHNTWVD